MVLGNSRKGIKMGRFVTEEILSKYQEYLYEEEKSEATIKKYMRDLGNLQHMQEVKRLQRSWWWYIRSISGRRKSIS